MARDDDVEKKIFLAKSRISQINIIDNVQLFSITVNNMKIVVLHHIPFNFLILLCFAWVT